MRLSLGVNQQLGITLNDDVIEQPCEDAKRQSVNINSGVLSPMLIIAVPVYVISTTIIAILALVVRCIPKVIHWIECGLTGFLEGIVGFVEFLWGNEYDDEIESHYLQVKELFSS